MDMDTPTFCLSTHHLMAILIVSTFWELGIIFLYVSVWCLILSNAFFHVYGDDGVVLSFILSIWNITLTDFLDIKLTFHSWDKSHLVMVYNPLSC